MNRLHHTQEERDALVIACSYISNVDDCDVARALHSLHRKLEADWLVYGEVKLVVPDAKGYTLTPGYLEPGEKDDRPAGKRPELVGAVGTVVPFEDDWTPGGPGLGAKRKSLWQRILDICEWEIF